MKVYHGTSMKIEHADLSKSRTDVDFGIGFYLTQNKGMAKKWAANKATSVINEYELNLEGLNVVKLNLDEQWLNFVSYNRGFGNIEFNTDGIDVIIGPTADDKLFGTLEQYFDGAISAEQAIRYLNVAGFSNQIVLKTEKAINNLSYLSHQKLNKQEQYATKKEAQFERNVALTSLKKMIELDKAEQNKNIQILKGEIVSNVSGEYDEIG